MEDGNGLGANKHESLQKRTKETKTKKFSAGRQRPNLGLATAGAAPLASGPRYLRFLHPPQCCYGGRGDSYNDMSAHFACWHHSMKKEGVMLPRNKFEVNGENGGVAGFTHQ